MMSFKNWMLSMALATSVVPVAANAALTLYTTSWSMYGENPYEYDGAYKNGRP